MLPEKSVSRFIQRQASNMQAYLRIRPLLLSLLVLPLVLMGTMGIAKVVNKEALLTASAMHLNTAAAGDALEAGMPDGNTLAREANRFGEDGKLYEGEMLKFDYPANWSLDSTYMRRSDTRYRLTQDRGNAVISISLVSSAIQPAEGMSQNAYLLEYLVDGFRGNDAYERYFLRQLTPVHIGGTMVSHVQYAAVNSALLSDKGLTSERGVVAGLLLPGDQIVTINLQTSHDNSYGNYLQVDALKPIIYDIIDSMRSVQTA